MISHDHRCIFVHIPKTGGTSVEDVIWPGPRTTDDLWMGFIDRYHNKYQTGGLQHLLATQIRTEVGTEVFSRYYKFSIARNPCDRAVSQFVFMDTRADLREFIGMKKGDGLKKYAELIRKKRHVQWEPQVNFLRDTNGDSLVDYIGRYESFPDSVFHALRTIGINAATIPHRKKGQRGPYQDYYDAESREMIGAMYAGDIEAFGYCFVEREATAKAGNYAVRP